MHISRVRWEYLLDEVARRVSRYWMEDGLVEIQLGLMMALSSLFFLRNGCHGVDGNGSYLHSDHRAPILDKAGVSGLSQVDEGHPHSFEGRIEEAHSGSHSDVARVQAACDRRISGALDNGAAIGKNSQFITIDIRPHRKIIGADRRQRRQAAGQIG